MYLNAEHFQKVFHGRITACTTKAEYDEIKQEMKKDYFALMGSKALPEEKFKLAEYYQELLVLLEGKKQMLRNIRIRQYRELKRKQMEENDKKAKDNEHC